MGSLAPGAIPPPPLDQATSVLKAFSPAGWRDHTSISVVVLRQLQLVHYGVGRFWRTIFRLIRLLFEMTPGFFTISLPAICPPKLSAAWSWQVSKVRYIAASQTQRAWWDDLYQLDRRPAGFDRVHVLETDAEPQSTGLLDAQGNLLYRIIEKQPIGFRPLKE
jgi:hypothetical protein